MSKGEHITTSNGNPPHPEFDIPESPAAGPIDPTTGQHTAYWVLDEAERAKGFVRPVRRSYKHVGVQGPKYPIRDLTDEEHARYDGAGYVKYEPYPPEEGCSAVGRFWTQQQLDNHGCGAVTTMGLAIAETYAHNPSFYGLTMCVSCRDHFPVGADGEFVWTDDGSRVGT